MKNSYTEKVLFPLSASQKNIWNLEQKYSGTSINNIGSSLRIKGRLNLKCLEKAVNILLERDKNLRLRVVMSEGEPMQYYSDYQKREFPVFDFSQTGKKEAEYWEESLAKSPMQIVDAPLCLFYIYKINEEEGGVFFKTHHLVTDGMSQVLISNIIISAYVALIRGEEPDRDSLPAYSLHIESENKYLKSKIYAADEEYWKEKIEGIDQPAALKECKSAVISSVGKRKTFVLSSMLSHAIDVFCSKYRVAPFAIIFMALAIYLRRITGSTDITIGVPINNRQNFIEKNTSGMFVSTVPFSCTINDDWTIKKFNQYVAEEWYELLRHQKYPFSRIAELASKSGKGAKLFNISLSFQAGSLFADEDVSAEFRGRWYYSGHQSEDLVIHMSQIGSEQYVVDYDFLTQVFAEAEIKGLHEHIISIMDTALKHPEMPLWKIPVTSESEIETVIFKNNNTYQYVRPGTIWDRFCEQAEEYPTRAAVIWEDTKVRYGELKSRAEDYSDVIARTLPSDVKHVVGIHMKKNPEMISAMLGIARTGNAWVILPADLPAERFANILEDSGAAMLFCDEQLEIKKNNVKIPVVMALNVPSSASHTPVPENITTEDMAYIVYTSGSTGRPKGVEIRQDSFINFADAMQPLYGYGAVLSLCNTGFDVFLLESLAPLMGGKTVVLMEKDSTAVNIADFILKYRVGVITMTPTRLRSYMNNKSFRVALKRIESIICGGEHLAGELIHDIELCTEARIYNQYGPSETTIGVSWQMVNGTPKITIGRPMPNCRMYVLDNHMQPLPAGVSGELYIGGVCVGKGYHNLPEMTKESFKPNPFEHGDILYKTGDIANWNHCGELVLTGRKDAQVKIRGQRVEPQEIALVVESHPGVNAAACKVVEVEGHPAIVVYYIASIQISETELMSYAATYLPDYMLPSVLVKMEEMPLSVNGKIDLKRLPAPDIRKTGREASGEIERKLLDIFKSSLEREDLDTDSDYFLAGGDSLKALETLSAIENKLGIKIKVSDIYTYKNVRRLAAFIGNHENIISNDVICDTSIPMAPLSFSYPMTPTQQSLYFQSKIDNTGIAYNMAGIFLLTDDIDLERLELAFIKLIEKEDILRTSFKIDQGNPVQMISGEINFHLDTINAMDPVAARTSFVRPFDLEKAPLLRAAIWYDSSRNGYLFLDMHHIISDGLSTPILLTKLNRLYNGEDYDTEYISFKDYACWYQYNRTVPTEQLLYWKRALTGTEGAPELPSDRKNHGTTDFTGGSIELEFQKALTSSCLSYCENGEITPFTLYAGIFALLLSRMTGSSDVIFGSPVSGRRMKATWQMIGPFINTLPVRIKIDRGMSVKDYLRYVKTVVVDVLDNQDVSLEEIMHEAGVERKAGGNALYNVLFSYRPLEDTNIRLGRSVLQRMPLDSAASKLNISFEIYCEDDITGVRVEYQSALYDRETVEIFTRSFVRLLRCAVEDDSVTVENMEAISEQDRIRLIDRPNRNSVPFSSGCIDEFIDENAIFMPDAPAVMFKNKTLTFREFKQKSDGIAAFLGEMGIGRGDCVGFACSRTEEMLLGLTGIMKSGACYVPMLVSFPDKRLEYMIETADVKAVLCDRISYEKLKNRINVSCLIMQNGTESYKCVAGRNPEDPIHVLFTSGSTGRPKGARISHGAISNLLSGLTPIMGNGQRVLCTTNVVFDVFITESLIALALGKCVVMADEEEMMLPWKVASLINSYEPSIMQMTPSRVMMCLDNSDFRQALGRIKVLIMAGEAVSTTLMDRLRETGVEKVFNLYGPTEAAVYVTYADITESEKPVIGKALPNCKLYVLDENGRNSIPGVPGELFIAGKCLADGYVNRPDLTAEAFVDNPFERGSRMYKTGDLVKLLADGNLEYMGRKDRQVKLNGQRIELTEIEGRMVASGEAAEAAVIPVYNDGRVSGLQGCVVASAGKKVNMKKLRQHLESMLPAYMIPSTIVEIAAMPRTASGKIDIKKLMEADANEQPNEVSEKSDADRQQDALTYVSVAEIKNIWMQAIGAEQIDPEKSFFEQGGTSLAALTVLTRYFENGWEMNLTEFYDYPTLQAQYDRIAGRSEDVNPAPPKEDPVRNGILVTGAAGFLGCHLIKELVDAGEDNIYGLVRTEGKLDDNLRYYFGDAWLDNNKIKITEVKGDVSQPDLGISDTVLPALQKELTQIIHAAADIRHYADKGESLSTNEQGTANACAFALKSGASLYHISTVSVSGDHILAEPDKICNFTERDSDIGQNWQDNVYVKGKFAAEQQVRAAMEKGLDAKIFRVGMLVGRASDGKYQRNPENNAFWSLIKGFAGLDCVPHGFKNFPVEISAVDVCARAIVLLRNGMEPVYHIKCPYNVMLGDIFDSLGLNIAERDYAEFIADMTSKVKEIPPRSFVQLMEEVNKCRNGGAKIVPVCEITERELRRRGLEWPIPDCGVLLKQF